MVNDGGNIVRVVLGQRWMDTSTMSMTPQKSRTRTLIAGAVSLVGKKTNSRRPFNTDYGAIEDELRQWARFTCYIRN